jgi:predicted GTPase
MDTASPDGIRTVRENVAKVCPNATVIDAASPVKVDDPWAIKGKRVLCVEDGPSLTHGGMKIGAGIVAAQKYGASEIIDPRPWLVGELKETFNIYPEIGTLLPAMGYSEKQLKDLETTINAADCDAIVIGTPIDLSRIISIKKPHTRVYYDLQSIGHPNLKTEMISFVRTRIPAISKA